MSTIATTDRFTRDAFLALDRSGRATVRAAVDRAILDAIRTGDVATATSLVAYRDDVLAKDDTTSRVEIDPATVIARRIVTLRHAADGLADGTYVPNGMDALDVDAIETALADFSDDVSDDATRTATAKITRSPKLNDVPALIGSVIGDDAMTVAEIASEIVAVHGSAPSSGAIGAAISRADDGEHDDYVFTATTKNGKVAAIAR